MQTLRQHTRSASLRLWLLASCTLWLSACDTPIAAMRYSPMVATQLALRDRQGAVNLAPYTGPKFYSVSCRVGALISPPDARSFGDYVHQALQDELKLARLYSDDKATPVLMLSLDNADFTSTRGIQGQWYFLATVSNAAGRRASFSETYDFESGFGGNNACQNTAAAMMPAVQDLVLKIVQSKEFNELIK